MKLKSSEPFWLVKNGIINSYPSLRENLDTEILIVGGGITGSQRINVWQMATKPC